MWLKMQSSVFSKFDLDVLEQCMVLSFIAFRSQVVLSNLLASMLLDLCRRMHSPDTVLIYKAHLDYLN